MKIDALFQRISPASLSGYFCLAISAPAGFLLAELGCQLGAEVFHFEDSADFDFGVLERCPFEPVDGLLQRVALPDPVAGDEFLRFGKGTVGDGRLLAGEFDAGTLGAVGASPSPASITPACTSSSLNLPMQ